MPKVGPVALLESLGLEGGGGVTVFLPEGRSCYHVYFRHRGRQINRSCGTAVYSDAAARAAEILAEVVRPVAAVRPLPGGKLSPSVPSLSEEQIGIEEIISVYDGWLGSAKPGQKRPRAETVKGYRRRLRQLADLLKADTVKSLSDKLCGLTHEKCDMSESNFVTMIRNAAAIFAEAPREYYATQNISLTDPFGGALPVAPERPHFEAPSLSDITILKQKANRELREAHPREWLLFLLTLGGGLRVQEATHLRWGQVAPAGISVSSNKDHKTKSGHSRLVRCGAGLLEQLEPLRGLPGDFVIAHGRGQLANEKRVPMVRCSRVTRRLAQWLREQGIPEKNPNHALRKTFGSVVANEHSVMIASRYLGHATVSVTESIYVGLLGQGPEANVI